MRARALHPDVLVVTSALLQVNCVIVRAGGHSAAARAPLNVLGARARRAARAETFVIDSPVLPEESSAARRCSSRPASPRRAGCSRRTPTGITCSGRWRSPRRARLRREQRRAARGRAGRSPAGAARLRRRALPGAPAAAAARRRCRRCRCPGTARSATRELELHPTGGHTADGMAIWRALGRRAGRPATTCRRSRSRR